MDSNSNKWLPLHEDSLDIKTSPKRLKNLAFDTTFTKGNNLLHQFVLSNSDPNHVISENNINAVLVSMSGATSINELNNNGYSALHLAVLQKNLFMVRKMLSCLLNLDVNTRCGFKGNENTALHFASKLGHLPIIQELLNKGAAIDSLNCYSQTPLFLAVKSGDLDAISILVSNGANIDRKDDPYYKSPLHYAAESGNLEVIKFLISKGADLNSITSKGYTILHCAAESSNLDSVKYLVKIGAAVNPRGSYRMTPLHCATKSGNLSIMKFLLDEGYDISSDNLSELLLLAAESNNLEVVRYLVENGADVNIRSSSGACSTPLHHATKYGNLALIKYLVSRGAYVDSKSKLGGTPLHLALGKRNVEMFKILFESCSDMNIRNGRNSTLLHLAVNSGIIEMVKILVDKIDKGVDVNAINDDKETPLHRAVLSVETEIVKLLVSKGANLNAKDRLGRIPLNCAVGNVHPYGLQDRLEIIEFLKGHGADVNSNSVHSKDESNKEAAKLLATKD